jgi:hypothetical protein
MKNGFARLSDADLCLKAGTILASITGNSYFPSPSPTVADLKETINSYSLAVQKAQDKSLQQIAEKNALKEKLIEQLHGLSNYVLYCAAGDVAIAMGSGFAISKPRQSRPALTEPEGLVLFNSVNRGELVLKLKRVANVQSYRYEITPHPATPDSSWKTNVSTISKNTFGGLVSGREYCCRVAAIGIKEQVVYSETVSRIAL